MSAKRRPFLTCLLLLVGMLYARRPARAMPIEAVKESAEKLSVPPVAETRLAAQAIPDVPLRSEVVFAPKDEPVLKLPPYYLNRLISMAAYVHGYTGPETPTRNDRALTRAESLTDIRIFQIEGDYREGRYVLAAMILRNINGGHRLSLNAPDDGNAVKISATGEILDYKVDGESLPIAAYNSQAAIKGEILFWIRQRHPK